MKKYHDLQTLDIALQRFRKNGAYKRHSKELTDADLAVLFCVKFHETEEDIKLSDIAERLHLTLPAVTHKVNDLEERGLITKATPKSDKRVTNIKLTLAAHVHIDEIVDSYYSPLLKITEHLGEADTKELIRIIDKVNSLGKIKS